jgi:hypothetical protein
MGSGLAKLAILVALLLFLQLRPQARSNAQHSLAQMAALRFACMQIKST